MCGSSDYEVLMVTLLTTCPGTQSVVPQLAHRTHGLTKCYLWHRGDSFFSEMNLSYTRYYIRSYTKIKNTDIKKKSDNKKNNFTKISWFAEFIWCYQGAVTDRLTVFFSLHLSVIFLHAQIIKRRFEENGIHMLVFNIQIFAWRHWRKQIRSKQVRLQLRFEQNVSGQ